MSLQPLVSLCVIRVETLIAESGNEASDPMASRMRGRREPTDINVETIDNSDKPVPLLASNNAQSTSRTVDQIHYVTGNPFVESTKGILHLFKEDELTKVDSAASRSSTLCMLSVPATMSCHDLITFTAAYQQNIERLRILRDGNPNQYMALITFRSPAASTEFYESFNGQPYSSLEPEALCHIVFISKVEVSSSGSPIAGHTELPVCPVCLERMDESVDGILTILCNHSFHSNCLSKWGDSSCPVCRYAQTPEPRADSSCMECVSEANNDALWICLICGHVGCSRYHQGHAFQHYRETHHCYAMQLGNNRVWDYVGDNFVHRLLQDKDDGKLVQNTRSPTKAEGEDVDEKVDSVQLEFTYLLTSQLETQREFFEEKLFEERQRASGEITELREKLGSVCEDMGRYKENFDTLSKEKHSLEKRVHSLTSKHSSLQSELSEEKALRKALESNQSLWRKKCEALELEKRKFETTITDLEEQIRDLMFYVEGKQKIESSENREEIAGGSIIIGESKPRRKARGKH